MLLTLVKDLRINPLRSFLTGFSMLLGIIAVLIAVLIGTIGKEYVRATGEQIFGRSPLVTGQIANASLDFTQLESLVNQLNSAGAATALVVQPQEELAFAQLQDFAIKKSLVDDIRLQKAVFSLDTVYVAGNYRKIYNLPLVTGRWLQTSKNSTPHFASLEIVLNKPAAQQLQIADPLYAFNSKSLNPTCWNCKRWTKQPTSLY